VPTFDLTTVLATAALGGAIATDVVATFLVEHAELRRDRRLWLAAAGLLAASLALLALALVEIPTAVAEALFVAVGSASVALIALRRGDGTSPRKLAALALLALGVVVLQVEVGRA
jgi:multidrug transporter EmrE-like cation transporter